MPSPPVIALIHLLIILIWDNLWVPSARVKQFDPWKWDRCPKTLV